MMKFLLLVFVLIFSVLGFAEFLHGLRMLFNKPKHKAITYSVVLLSGVDAPEQLSYSAEQLLWYGKAYADNVIAINSGLSADVDLVCKDLAEKYSILYCNFDELKVAIDSLKK